MTAVVQQVVTGEVVTPMNEAEANRITTRISLKLETVGRNWEEVVPLIHQALERDAHAALGYRSPSEYLVDRFAGEFAGLPPGLRAEFVQEIKSTGVSTRALAPVFGVSQKTIALDLHREIPGQVIPEVSPAAKTTGIDGKAYTAPAVRKQRRRPWPDAARDAVHDLAKRLTTVSNLATDDRVKTNNTARFRAELVIARDALQQAIDDLGGESR